ncbi:MAG: Sec-independent protein translocase protein TatB [Pseudomonadota bacterium]|nr:Sec-independent protein translocase protein TatB [Pseudomonadota bacterium]
MFDIGGWEFLLIGILGIIVVGPKELPRAIRTVRIFISKTRTLARDFQAGLDEVAREADLDKVSDELREIVDPDTLTSEFREEIENSIDPGGDLKDVMTFDTAWTDDELVENPSSVPLDNNVLGTAEPSLNKPGGESEKLESIPEKDPTSGETQ